MTEVLFDLTKPTQPGLNAPAAGYLECRPTLRRTVDASIVLPDKFDVRLVDGIATADLAPTVDGTWAWEIVERANRGMRRLVSVPASGPVNYKDLDDVDPTTLDPTTPVVPAYKALIDAVDEKADEAKTAADGAVELAESASTAAGAAVDAAGQVADDLAEFDASLDGKVGADVATPGTATEAAVAAKIATATTTPGAARDGIDERVELRAVPRTPSTGQWHFDVLQGQNNGTKLPFTSRVVGSDGSVKNEQINAKPTTDLSEGIIDWQHNSAQGDLIHLTAGAGMTNTSNAAALIALGLDNGYPTGIFINNKGTATRGIGLKIAQNDTINVATDAYGIEVTQASPTSPAVHMLQRNNTAPLMRLQAENTIALNTTLLLEVIAAGGQKAAIRAKTGEYYSLADVITHDGGGFLSIATGLAADSHMTKQLSDGFHIRAHSGSAGIYYPGRIGRTSGGLLLQAAPNTSGGPAWTGLTWQTGVAVKNGSAKARVLLGSASPATTENEGYPYIPVVSGTPTGTPTAETGFAPFVIDSSGSRLWAYVGGAWKSTVLA